VAFLAVQLVGPTGSVIGVDRTPTAISRARTRAESKRISNFQFVEGDPTEMRFDEDFDAVVGRLILMYYSDPVEALRKLLLDLQPGGIVAFQEVDSSGCKSHPISPSYQRCLEWIMQTFRVTGAQATIGLELHSIMAEGDLVMCEASCQGTHLGEFPMTPPLQVPTLAPNGKTFKVKHIHRFRLKEGKIIEHFAVRDDLGMFQQLGHFSVLSD
jgi:SAM-dependent methyltransferase